MLLVVTMLNAFCNMHCKVSSVVLKSKKEGLLSQCFNFNVDYTTAKTAGHICFLLMHKHKVVNNCYCATMAQETVKSSAAEMNSKVTQSLVLWMVLPFDRSHVTSFYSFLLYMSILFQNILPFPKIDRCYVNPNYCCVPCQPCHHHWNVSHVAASQKSSAHWFRQWRLMPQNVCDQLSSILCVL